MLDCDCNARMQSQAVTLAARIPAVTTGAHTRRLRAASKAIQAPKVRYHHSYHRTLFNPALKLFTKATILPPILPRLMLQGQCQKSLNVELGKTCFPQKLGQKPNAGHEKGVNSSV